ncbi:sulfatase-like hydrolase/transferase [Tropicimonas sp. TH_r6]|uniref:sulfatase family protein n=1 Tax=Tropicimonas sp. TH_r6 TaxID=3082085 RepID=UPI0029559277|nr:sulfatase-like hydrolase/transferase [Tropicimonas sp. TH_r6]MDV7142820.1 sulfatase-like hydrolase/transferase [Tropicimonas sp. TH_r6]
MSKRPNIVFIITDQQRYDTIAALGFDHMITPNLDKLADRGVAFEKMYIPAPSCAPSRAALFTGTYPHTNGVFRNDEEWSYCWVKDLAEAGYHTVNIGKMHTWPVEGAFGFHERHVTENKDRDHDDLPFYLDNWDKGYFVRGKEKPSRVTQRRRQGYEDLLGAWVWEDEAILHPDVFVPQLAKCWIDRYPGNEPFFLQVGIPGPHPPYDPTQEYLDKYQGRDLPDPIPADDIDEQPSAYQKLRQHHLEDDADGIVHLTNPTPEQARRQRLHYYANVSMIDDQVGQIIEALDRRGVLEETVVIFTSDHGDSLTDHGHSQKWNMYESTVHVPAIVSWPSRFDGGRRLGDLVNLFDFGPTILELAGIEVPDWMEAQSLIPLMNGEQEDRPRVFCEHSNDALLEGTRMVTMVREGDFKLVHFVDSEEGQLFNLASDPQELENLWLDPGHADTRRRLVDEILRWRTESGIRSQGYPLACVRGAMSMMSPPGRPARGQHREGSRGPRSWV